MVAEKIKKYIDMKGIKQTFLVENTTMNANQIHLSLNGKRTLGADEYVEICDALRVSLNTFIPESSTDFTLPPQEVTQ